MFRFIVYAINSNSVVCSLFLAATMKRSKNVNREVPDFFLPYISSILCLKDLVKNLNFLEFNMPIIKIASV